MRLTGHARSACPISVYKLRTDTWLSCPYDCPCDAPKQRIQSQREPSRSIGEVIEIAGFAGKIEDGREADFRLANRRLRPLGHLTADGKYT